MINHLRRWAFPVATVMSVGLFGGMLYIAGPGRVLSNIYRVGLWGFAAFFINSLLIVFLIAVGWGIILWAMGCEANIFHVFLGTLMGFSINFLTPSMYLGGEPVRIYYISRRYQIPTSQVMATVVLSKFQELSSLVGILFLGSIYVVFNENLSLIFKISIGAVDIAAGVVFLLIGRGLYSNGGVFRRPVDVFMKIGLFPAFFRRLRPKVEDMENLIHKALQRDRGAMAVAFIAHFMAIFLVVLKPAIFFWFLFGRHRLALGALLLVFTLSQLILASPLALGALGVLEGGQIGIFQLVGIDPSQSIAFTSFIRMADLIMVAAGLGLLSYFSLSQFMAWKEKPKL